MEDDLIISLLQQINDGLKFFSPKGSSPDDLRAFQTTARALIHMDQVGYVEHCRPRRENRTGNSFFVEIFVKGITYSGERLLEQSTHQDDFPPVRLNEADVNMHANVETLTKRMDDALHRKDYAEVLHSSASIFETLAKDILGNENVKSQSLKSFFDKYRKQSLLPDSVLEYVLAIYDRRNTTPLAGHGSTEKPTVTPTEATILSEMTKAFVMIEYRLQNQKRSGVSHQLCKPISCRHPVLKKNDELRVDNGPVPDRFGPFFFQIDRCHVERF